MDPKDALVKLLFELGLLNQIPERSLYCNGVDGPIKLLDKAGLLVEHRAILAVSGKLGVEYLDIENPDISGTFSAGSFVGQVAPELCWNSQLLPLKEEKSRVLVACTNPFDIDAVRSLEFSLSKTVKLVIVEEHKLRRALSEYFPPSKLEVDKLNKEAQSESLEIVDLAEQDQNVDPLDSNSAPIIKLVNKIISDAVMQRSSDIHIQPGQHQVEVRFRVDGKMHNAVDIPKRLQAFVTSRLKLLAGMDISEKRRPQDGRFRIKVGSEQIDIRASSLPTAFGESFVMRLLQSNTEGLSFPALGFPKEIQEGILRALRSHGKMLLVTGPTGSGKTTTLYTCLHYLKDGTTNIITIENPIEYRIPGINQIQVNEAIDMTFAAALKSIMRQDPDIIMVGEIRDKETALIAIQAAQTGHKVLSSLHTNDALASITRLLNLEVPPYGLATSLAGILAQRLVRKICSNCIEGDCRDESLAAAKTWGLAADALKRGQGCKQCDGSGYKGRIPLFSYLETNEEIEKLITEQADMGVIIQAARRNGYRELHEGAIDLVRQGLTSIDEIQPYIEEAKKHNTQSVQAKTLTEASSVSGRVAAPTNQSIRKPKVLLVEDNDDVRTVLSMLLKKEMFEVVEAENGQAALETIYSGAEPPTIVLCDLMMPVMDGKEFLTKLRSSPATSNIPVVILTAADTDENHVGLLELGARDFISKSGSSAVMLTRIRKVLANNLQ